MGLLSELRRTAIPAIPAIPADANSGNSRNSSGERPQVRVSRACADLGLPGDRIAARADFDALADCDDAILVAYVRALAIRIDREAGRVPDCYTTAAHCVACGPVWLWPGAERVQACPWCWNRRAGRFIPRPPVTCGSCAHAMRDPLNPEAGAMRCSAAGSGRWPEARHVCATWASTRSADAEG